MKVRKISWLLPLILIILSHPSLSQEKKWDLSIGAGLYGELYGEGRLNDPHKLFPLHPDAATYAQEVGPHSGAFIISLAGSHQLKKWLKIGATLQHDFNEGAGLSYFPAQNDPDGLTEPTRVWVSNPSGSPNNGQYRTSQFSLGNSNPDEGRLWGFQPYAALDLKAQDPHTNAELIVGFLGTFSSATHQIIVRSQDLNPSTGTQYIHQVYDIKWRYRTLGIHTAFRWLDYFGDHFGYSLTISYRPYVAVRTEKIFVEGLRLHGIEQPIQKETFDPQKNPNLHEENFTGWGIGLSMALHYRF